MGIAKRLVKLFEGWQISLGLTIATIIIAPAFTYLGFFLFTDMHNAGFSVLLSILIPVALVPPFSYFFLRNLKLLDQSESKNEELIAELQKALKDIKTLEGLIPICANCKKIRDDQGYWHQVEEFVKKHSNVEFSHGICPECSEKIYHGLDKKST